jgi:hypothetical protein
MLAFQSLTWLNYIKDAADELLPDMRSRFTANIMLYLLQGIATSPRQAGLLQKSSETL